MHVHILQDRFTPRQASVFKLLVKGMADKKIAKELGVSPKAVSAHCHEIYRIVGANSQESNARCAAISLAILKKIILITEGDGDEF